MNGNKATYRLPGTLLYVLAAFSLLTAARAQNLLVNGSFETPPVTNKTHAMFPDPATMYPWQTTAPEFELWTNGWVNHKTGVGPTHSADGGQNIEILSNTNQATVWQVVPTIPGSNYVFSFFHTPRPGTPSVLTVSLNTNIVAVFYENGVGLTNFAWEQFATNFTADSNYTTVSFSDLSLNYGGAGTHIDGVTIEQNLIVNGSFEAPVDHNGTHVTNVPAALMAPWQTTADIFEIWPSGWYNKNTGVGPCYSADGLQNLEILSDTNNVSVWQTVPTVPGSTYTLSFFHTPRPGAESTLTVSINSNTLPPIDEQGVGLTNFAWQWFVTNFVADSNFTTINFNDAAPGGAGTHIDGVVLESAPDSNTTQVVQSPLAVLARPVLRQPPLLMSFRMLDSSHIEFYWPALPNHSYQVQYCDSIGGAWENLGETVVSAGTSVFMEDSPSAGVPQRFYRVVHLQ